MYCTAAVWFKWQAPISSPETTDIQGQIKDTEDGLDTCGLDLHRSKCPPIQTQPMR